MKHYNYLVLCILYDESKYQNVKIEQGRGSDSFQQGDNRNT